MPLVRETDEAVQPSTYEMHESRARLDTKWQMSFAVTPSGDGQSLTRCILVIAVSCATRKPRLYKLKIKGGNAPRPPPPPPKIKGKEEGREEGREEGKATAILQNAKRMKELGIDVETIMKVTGLEHVTISNL